MAHLLFLGLLIVLTLIGEKFTRPDRIRRRRRNDR